MKAGETWMPFWRAYAAMIGGLELFTMGGARTA